MTKKKKNPHHGSTLDSFLKEEGVLEEFRAAAVKEVIAWQIGKAMKDKKLSKNKMAALMQNQPRSARPAARSGAGQRHAGDATSRRPRTRPRAARGAGMSASAVVDITSGHCLALGARSS